MRPKFSRPIPRLFLRPKFSRPIPRLFFETKYFRDRYRDFFSRLNIFETDTETFFRDQNFRDRDRYSQKIEKSLDTEKSRDEMSHSAIYYLTSLYTRVLGVILSGWHGNAYAALKGINLRSCNCGKQCNRTHF